MNYAVLLWSAIGIVVVVLLVWAVSLAIKDASIIDVAWGFGFVVVAWVAVLTAGGPQLTRRTAVLIATTVWGLRLTLHLGKRNLGKGEDFRYRVMRKKYGNKFVVFSLRLFLIQGALMFVVSLPVQVAMMRHADRDGWLPALFIGAVVWLVGMFFETVGDLQLAKFKADPNNAGKVLDTGLWAWTRHPNYFGDTCAWWGIWIMACAVAPALATVVGPLAMTFLLRKVSGVPMLERTMAKRRPGYDDYVKATSAFIPRLPKRRPA
jgi:steroid 5-alpha reductase family enzyme